MKPKPIFLISTLIAISIVAIFFFGHFKNSSKSKINSSKSEETEVKQFLTKFNKGIQSGNLDSIESCYFWPGGRDLATDVFVRTIETDFQEGGIRVKVELNVEASTIMKTSFEGVRVKVPVVFTYIYDSYKPKQSVLILTIRKSNTNQFKIIRADTQQFGNDLHAFTSYIYNDIELKEAAPFAPITLASLKTASQLKTKYDSVAWFEHLNEKTYYFVVKGKLNAYFTEPEDAKQNHDEVATYKMGLVNPELKEIIPVEYDLIHNINGTIDGLIEVEKGNKKGFFDLEGKNVVKVQYDQVIPLNDSENVALLKNGNDFFYLKRDLTITDILADFKIADIVTKIKYFQQTHTLNNSGLKNIMEFNSMGGNSVVVSPSYLVDLQLQPKFILLQNTLRHTDKSDNLTGDPESDTDDPDDIIYYTTSYQNYVKNEGNRFDNIYFSIFSKNHDQITKNKNVIVVDKSLNKLYGVTIDAGLHFDGEKERMQQDIGYNENSFKVINDTLLEFKTTASFHGVPYSMVRTGPSYHYMNLINDKMEEITPGGWFPFTRYEKIDNSYLKKGCYDFTNSTVYPGWNIATSMLYEMYERYGYKGTTTFDLFDKGNKSANKIYNESFSDIERYNVQWLLKKRTELLKNKKVAISYRIY